MTECPGMGSARPLSDAPAEISSGSLGSESLQVMMMLVILHAVGVNGLTNRLRKQGH